MDIYNGGCALVAYLRYLKLLNHKKSGAKTFKIMKSDLTLCKELKAILLPQSKSYIYEEFCFINKYLQIQNL